MNRKKFERGAGILMPISSLPSKYGIGTLGKEAYRFADWLKLAGQKYWQVLPVGPTGFGDSPYQSFSAFAGNPYFIDLDILVEDGLISENELLSIKWCDTEDKVNYSYIFANRFAVLKKAFQNSNHRDTEEYRQFVDSNSYWLQDYSLFMALKEHFHNCDWTGWDDDIRLRNSEAVDRYSSELSEQIDFWKFCQYIFYKQWNKLKRYVNELGIKIIGDVPLYVALDSADAWANGELFDMDELRRPVNVAGVPPDYFSQDGQLWGNPLYNWKRMEEDGFSWWRKRIEALSKLYDVIRIDHFIGIARYYAIPMGSSNAINGMWKEGPARKLTEVINDSVGEARIIAEDLGVIMPEVRELMENSGWPGMKVLLFAFDSGPTNEYLPHNYKTDNCVLYGGTHDNDTIVGYINKLSDDRLKQILEYLSISDKKDIPRALIKAGYASIASLSVFQMQDVLGLDDSARMNTPAVLGDNWSWRMLPHMLSDEDAKWLSENVYRYNR